MHLNPYCLKRLLALSLTLSCVLNRVDAQPAKIPEVRGQLAAWKKTAGFEKDTAYINLLNNFSGDFYAVNVDSVLYYAQKAYALSKKINYKKGEAESLRSMGDFYALTGDFTSMLSCFQQTLSIAEKINDNKLAANTSRNIGGFYLEVGRYDEAMANFQKAHLIVQQKGYTVLEIYVLSDIADTWFQRHDVEKALHYHQEALRLARQMNSHYCAAYIRNDIGKTLCAKGQYEEAISFHLPSLQYYIQTNDKLGETHTTAYLAHAYWNLKKPDKALPLALKSYALANDIKNKRAISVASQRLADIYQEKGNYQTALKYFRLYKDFSDSIFNEQTRKKTGELETRFAYEKKAELLKAAQTKQNLLHAHRLQQLRLQAGIAVLVVLLLTGLVITLYRSKTMKQKTNQLLEARNNEITQQKEEIEKQAALLKVSNQQKDKLFSIVAHDLRGPLGSLKSLLDFLREKRLSEAEATKMMAEFSRNVNYSSDLVNNLLHWATSQMNGVTVQPAALSLHQIAGDVVDLFAKQAADKKIELTNELDDTFIAWADKDMIQLVIRNLVNNAIKFCKAGDRISVQGKMNGKYTEICIADTGTGIKEEVLQKICGNESVTTYGTSREKGTGLGLPLCKEFAEANGGTFRVESEWGNGSRFYFTVPIHFTNAPL
jgi:two-component system, sensor histidine kinase and response regulator